MFNLFITYSRRLWKDTIQIILKINAAGYGLDAPGSEYEQVVGSFAHRNESSDSKRCVKFFE